MTLRWRILWGLLLGPMVLLGCGRAQPPAPPAPQAQVQAAPSPAPMAPPHARETLAYIRQHGYAPPGFMGGRFFGNYEGVLPRFDGRHRRIQYREWDVHPLAEKRARGVERLVTGSDGRAWYTADHYQTFVQVQE